MWKSKQRYEPKLYIQFLYIIKEYLGMAKRCLLYGRSVNVKKIRNSLPPPIRSAPGNVLSMSQLKVPSRGTSLGIGACTSIFSVLNIRALVMARLEMFIQVLQTRVKDDTYLAWSHSVRAVASQHKQNTPWMKVLHVWSLFWILHYSIRYHCLFWFSFSAKVINRSY